MVLLLFWSTGDVKIGLLPRLIYKVTNQLGQWSTEVRTILIKIIT